LFGFLGEGIRVGGQLVVGKDEWPLLLVQLMVVVVVVVVVVVYHEEEEGME